MNKKLLFILSTLFLLTVYGNKMKVLASLQDGTCTSTEECNSYINELSAKVNELSKARDTLANQITSLNSQIQLTLLRISQTQTSIVTLQNEISELSGKIGKLDVSLNHLSSVFISQITQNYKLQKRVPVFSFLATANFNTFLDQYKYISLVQAHSRATLFDWETTRTTFDYEKAAKEKKQTELEVLKKKLSSQKINLADQKTAKDNLLTQTKNDETKYQQILSVAISQLNALRSFSSSAGGSRCLDSSPGGGSDGNFYSQRDPKWCKQVIGLSCNNASTCASMGEAGCYVSSISMVFKKLGQDISPSTYASNPGNFSGLTAYALQPVPPSGYHYEQSSYSSGKVDEELKNGRYVIAEIKMSGSVSGVHFIVIISGTNGNYKVHDPWYGADLNFTEHYNTSLIRSLRLITKN
jgi:peptidoglycan hydrolase CwlO-like protein